MPDAIGPTISHYRILEKLGEGGMGVVYKAEDTKLRRTVALKFLPPSLLHAKEDRRRFVQEAQASASLNHPNIATVYEIDENGEAPFIVLEYIEGESLADRVKTGPMRLEEALRISVEIAEGLQAAHEKGVVHRDVKAQNIMVTTKGQVKILDFGLAKLRGGSVVTRVGITLGTMGYMSPEQLRGEPADTRSDLWALGVLLYEMVAGRRPFQGDYEEAVAYQVLNGEPEPLTAVRTGVPIDLERIGVKLLQKDPSARYQSTSDLLVDLRQLQRKLAGKYEAPVSLSAAARRPRGAWRYSTRAVLLAVLAAVLSVTFLLTRPWSGSPETQKSVAVLPFQNFSDSKEDEFFAEGVTEDIITQVSKIAELRVIARTSVMRYKGAATSIRDVGRELAVGAVVEGSVRRAGNQIRIVAQLIDAKTEGHLWSETYDQEATQVLAIQSDVARNIASALKATLVPEERERFAEKRAVNKDAYESYLRGRYLWNKRTTADIQAAVGYFQRAVALDSSFGLAYTGLASAYAVLPQYGLTTGTYWPLAMAAAEKGLELDNASAEAHAVIGLAKKSYEWDWAGAEREFTLALKLNPGFATAHQWYGLYFLSMGKLDEAMKETGIARSLDPLSLVIATNVATELFLQRQYDKAAAAAAKALELDSTYVDARIQLAMALGSLGRFDEAVASLKRARADIGGSPRGLPQLGVLYALSGKRELAQQVLDSLFAISKAGYPICTGIASIYSVLDDKDQTFHWLELAMLGKEVGITFIKLGTAWDNIRSDARYRALLKKMGLPE